MNIDTSDPYLKSVEIPSEAKPGLPFTVKATVDNRHEVAIPQEGTCQEGFFGTNVGWRTPISIHVDGEEIDRKGNCTSAATAKKNSKFTLTLSEGTYTITVKAWIKHKDTVADMARKTVVVSPDSTDPEKPDSEFWQKLREILGGSTRSLLMAGAIAFAVFMVI